MESLVKHFIKDYNITIKNDKQIEESFKLMLFRITTLISTSAMADHRSVINKKDIYEIVNAHLSCMRKKIKGGEAMPSEFYGYKIAGNVYSESNENVGAVNVSKIDFDHGIARPAQGPAFPDGMQGGGNKNCELFKKSKAVRKIIKEIIEKDNSMKISSENLNIILKAIDAFIYKFGSSLKDKTITDTKYKKMINTKKFLILK
jgi:hypothetical protein